MNYPQQSAQGLASLGRGNDSMLVHMTPREVQGLQGLAMAHGGSLTINPKTGLPEAGFLDSILPTVAGFGLNALFPGLGALGTGLLVGGVTALTSGDLGKGVMAGFGAGSGAGLGSTFSKMGQSAIGGITPEAAKMAVGENIVGQLPANVAQNAASNLGMFNSTGATAAMGAAGNAVPGAALSNFNNLGLSSQSIGPGVNSAVNAMGAAPSAAQLPQSSLLGDAGNRLGDMYKGASEFAKDPFGAGYDAFKAQGGNTFDLLSPVASVGMEALKPEPYAGYQDPDKGKYRGPQGQLNLSDRFDTGLRLVAKGGYIDGYAMGGTVQSGGIRDLYGTPDNPPIMSSGLGGFWIGDHGCWVFRVSDRKFKVTACRYDLTAGRRRRGLEAHPFAGITRSRFYGSASLPRRPLSLCRTCGRLAPRFEGRLRCTPSGSSGRLVGARRSGQAGTLAALRQLDSALFGAGAIHGVHQLQRGKGGSGGVAAFAALAAGNGQPVAD